MKVLIANEHALFREGLRHVLAPLSQSLLILEADSYPQTLSLTAQHPDLNLLLLDLGIPGMCGFTLLNVLTKRYPALPIVILSAAEQPSDMQRAMHSGAMGFIPNSTTGAVMIHALRWVLSGSVYMPREIVTPSVELHRAWRNSHLKINLTPRQQEVFALMQQGQPNKLIASQLCLAEATVKMHVSAILKKLAVTNRTQAVVTMEKLDRTFAES